MLVALIGVLISVDRTSSNEARHLHEVYIPRQQIEYYTIIVTAHKNKQKCQTLCHLINVLGCHVEKVGHPRN